MVVDADNLGGVKVLVSELVDYSWYLVPVDDRSGDFGAKTPRKPMIISEHCHPKRTLL